MTRQSLHGDTTATWWLNLAFTSNIVFTTQNIARWQSMLSTEQSHPVAACTYINTCFCFKFPHFSQRAPKVCSSYAYCQTIIVELEWGCTYTQLCIRVAPTRLVTMHEWTPSVFHSAHPDMMHGVWHCALILSANSHNGPGMCLPSRLPAYQDNQQGGLQDEKKKYKHAMKCAG